MTTVYPTDDGESREPAQPPDYRRQRTVTTPIKDNSLDSPTTTASYRHPMTTVYPTDDRESREPAQPPDATDDDIRSRHPTTTALYRHPQTTALMTALYRHP